MILWINGAFGSGKTTVAEILHTKIAHSYIYDPENIGLFLQHNLPEQLRKSDFQEHKEWREWNIHMLKKIYQEYEGDIIVPMTVYKQPMYDEIFKGLKESNMTMHHFQLEVSKGAILKRLKERSLAEFTWGAEKVDEILEAFQAIPIDEKINNETILPEETAQIIMDKVYT